MPSLLTISQKSRLKASVAVALVETAQIYRRSLSKTNAGGVVSAEPSLIDTVACRLLPAEAQLQERAGGTPEVEHVRVLVAGAADTVANDELVIGEERFLVSGVIYRWPQALKRLECTRL